MRHEATLLARPNPDADSGEARGPRCGGSPTARTRRCPASPSALLDDVAGHRVPFFLGGRTDARNLWPEAGPIPNRKDALERYVRNRICDNATMRLRAAVRIFLADWVTYSRRYGL